MKKPGTITYRWLGVNGLEFTLNGYTLLVDPFFSRPSLLDFLLNRPAISDEALVRQYISRADAVLVTHPHHDHLMDVPAVVRQSGAAAYGSANACRLLAAFGIPEEKTRQIHRGNQLKLGPFSVSVLPAWHTHTPLDPWITGPVKADLQHPPRLLDFKLDEDFSFLLDAGEIRFEAGNEPVHRVDFLFLAPYLPYDRLSALLERAQPRQIVVTHWENFFSPLSRPLRPVPFRIRLDEFTRQVRSALPGCEVILPEIFKEYSLNL